MNRQQEACCYSAPSKKQDAKHLPLPLGSQVLIPVAVN